MQNYTLDRYLQKDSRIHQLDPRAKVVTAVLLIVATVLLPDGAWLAFLLTWLLIVGITRLAQLPYRLVFKRSLIILPFLLTAVTILINIPGPEGVVRFVSIAVRGWLAVQLAILLTATTTFPDLMHALNHLHVPLILVNIITFMYRYLFVLTDEAGRLLRARQARSARLPGTGVHGGSVLWRAKIAGQMIGQLFSRSLDRSDRIYMALLARGYDGRFLTINPHHMRQPDWLAILFAIFVILLMQVVIR
jgi:cobalt/nickel transport system permease protein